MEKVSVSTAIGHGSGGPEARVKSSSKGPMGAGFGHTIVRVPKGKQAHIPAPHDGDEKRQRSRRCSEEFSFLLNVIDWPWRRVKREYGLLRSRGIWPGLPGIRDRLCYNSMGFTSPTIHTWAPPSSVAPTEGIAVAFFSCVRICLSSPRSPAALRAGQRHLIEMAVPSVSQQPCKQILNS